ncbi:MAG: putative metal-binding motif-containing protein [Archangium sp.]|nr:putative metal-binding motif-containing protein [Archangium sp.]
MRTRLPSGLVLLSLCALSCGPTMMAVCTSDQQCQDGVFCNGTERCAPGGPGADAKGCVASVFSCPAGLFCSERLQVCRARCSSDADCSDGLACNGAELCRSGDADVDAMGCKPGPPLCPSVACTEARVLEYAPGVARVVPARCARSDAGPCQDSDNDGHPAASCGGDDCDDGNQRVNPGVREVCDALEVDEDCNPCTVGEVDPLRGWGDSDLDGDGYARSSCRNVLGPNEGVLCTSDGGTQRWSPVEVVRRPGSATYVQGRDCDDSRFEVNPNASETCNSRDDDCDGETDEGVTRPFFTDSDLDGHGAGRPVERCELAPGLSVLGNDCDDSNPAIRPGVFVCAPVVTAADGVRLCQADGGWADETCLVQRSCVPQPNGTGVCQ